MWYKFIFTLFMIFLITSCGTSTGLVGTDAASRIKPVQQITFKESQLPVNLEVIVHNVADQAASNKNEFRLYINDKLIQPSNKVDNTTKNYFYTLKLQPGLYDVKGTYYWHDGWTDARTDIKTQELVQVDDRGRTILEKEIPKDWRGIVKGKNLLFDVNYESFEKISETPSSNEKPDFESSMVDVKQVGLLENKIKLQINTDPSNSDIYIDDQMVGQSPISWWVDKSTSHVVQARYDNFRSAFRIVSPEEMYSQDKVIIIQRLEPIFTPQIVTSPTTRKVTPDTTVAAQQTQPQNNTQAAITAANTTTGLPNTTQNTTTSGMNPANSTVSTINSNANTTNSDANSTNTDTTATRSDTTTTN
jgi:hypothetical protein